MHRTLIIGAHGQLGRHVAGLLGAHAIPITRNELDLRSDTLSDDFARLLATHQPECVVNAAAFTDVAAAEKDDSDAVIVNGIAPGILARACHKSRIKFIHCSTDYVFDGHASQAYLESDTPRPINRYGASKWQGEQAVISQNLHAAVLRFSWLYDHSGKNFFTMMRGLAASQTELRIVADQCGVPTYSGDAARMLLEFSVHYNIGTAPAGIYHVVPDGYASWHGFARAILPGFHPMHAILGSEYSTQVVRPKNSRLDNRKIKALGITVKHWRDGLNACKREAAHATA
jgi:dTDP-4-dehydrorhamnose reductase